MDWIKNMIAIAVSAGSWWTALNVQDKVSFVLATIASIVGTIFIAVGIANRIIDHKIKKEVLKREQAKNETL